MMRILFAILTAVFVIAVQSPPGVARAAGQVSHYRFAGNSVEAYFESFDSSECVETTAAVTVISGQAVNENISSDMATAFVMLSQVDFCTVEPTRLLGVAGSTDLTAQQFQMDHRFSSARLNTELELCDFASGSGLCFPVTVNLNWSGTGRLSAGSLSTMMQDAGVKIHVTSGGMGREAEASGSISNGTTNFIPGKSMSARLGAMRDAEFSIQH